MLLDSTEIYNQHLNYLHWNPVTAGFVAEPLHWIYNSSTDYFTDKKGLLDIIILDGFYVNGLVTGKIQDGVLRLWSCRGISDAEAQIGKPASTRSIFKPGIFMPRLLKRFTVLKGWILLKIGGHKTKINQWLKRITSVGNGAENIEPDIC